MSATRVERRDPAKHRLRVLREDRRESGISRRHRRSLPSRCRLDRELQTGEVREEGLKRIAQHLTGLAVLVCTTFLLVSCGAPPGNAEATRVFAECLSRNGIEAERVEVTMGAQGYVEGISLVIVREGDVAYDPTVRLVCTEEVEASQ